MQLCLHCAARQLVAFTLLPTRHDTMVSWGTCLLETWRLSFLQCSRCWAALSCELLLNLAVVQLCLHCGACQLVPLTLLPATRVIGHREC